MAKEQTPLTFEFDDPNTPEELRELLKRILVEKLLALPREDS